MGNSVSGLRCSDQAFSRAAGTPRIEGNSVRLWCDAAENYPAWLEAIAAAQRYVHFESYIIRADKAGRQYPDLSPEKAEKLQELLAER